MQALTGFTAKKYLVIAVLSVVLGLGIIRWHSQGSVPFCVNSAGCSARETLRGTVTNTIYGFPATYRQVAKFVPDNQNPASGGYPGYVEAKNEVEGFSIFKAAANIVFWFALLHLVAQFVKPRKRARAEAVAPAAPKPQPQTPEPADTATPPTFS